MVLTGECVKKKKQNKTVSAVEVEHAFNLSTLEAEVGEYLQNQVLDS